MGDLGSIPALGRTPGEGKGYPLQYPGLENSMDYSPWGHKELDLTEPLSLLSLGLMGFPDNSVGKEYPAMRRPWCNSWVQKICWRRDRLPTSVFLGFPCGSAGKEGKESTHNTGDLGSIPGLGRSPGEGKLYPLQYSGLENSMDYSPWGHKELDTTERL